MSVNKEKYLELLKELGDRAVLVAVSKTKPATDIQELYDLGQRDFGENYVQELVDKAAELPQDIRWHFIGHLQSNKVKYLAPFVHLVHGVDSASLLKEIDKQGAKTNRVIDCLLQVHIAQEETKFGFDQQELEQLHVTGLNNIAIRGMMGMASFSNHTEVVRQEFNILKQLFDKYNGKFGERHAFTTLSMGMSGDYPVALAEGSTMIRVGSLLFGERNMKH
ncbi:MAG: YggS family pyridoxal phosphate-dependent enzyme [Ferruginibacter sp.]|nr:YggS family pyridoxal phosphate-dependent enzyme [Ferruginibacter sp.]